MNSQFSDDGVGSEARHRKRKHYSSPTLIEYGGLGAITLAAGNAGNKDGAANAPQRTH